MSKVIRSAWKWGNTSQMAKMAQISSRGSSLLESTNVPTRIEGFSNVSKIACGPANSAFIGKFRLLSAILLFKTVENYIFMAPTLLVSSSPQILFRMNPLRSPKSNSMVKQNYSPTYLLVQHTALQLQM